MKFPLPKCDEELALLTTWYFGVPLHVQLHLWDGGGSYEVKETYNSYHGNGFAYSSSSSDGYDSSRDFWAAVFGRLTCGGIAGSSYGQFKVVGYRHAARLRQWMKYRISNRGNSPRRCFVRLAADVGGGERARIRGMRSLIDGREDGASAVFDGDFSPQPREAGVARA